MYFGPHFGSAKKLLRVGRSVGRSLRQTRIWLPKLPAEKTDSLNLTNAFFRRFGQLGINPRGRKKVANVSMIKCLFLGPPIVSAFSKRNKVWRRKLRAETRTIFSALVGYCNYKLLFFGDKMEKSKENKFSSSSFSASTAELHFSENWNAIKLESGWMTWVGRTLYITCSIWKPVSASNGVLIL